jgi:hypothetical protein
MVGSNSSALVSNGNFTLSDCCRFGVNLVWGSELMNPAMRDVNLRNSIALERAIEYFAFVLFLLCVLDAPNALAGNTTAAYESHQPVVIYYGNETTGIALGSENYRALFAILRDLRNETGLNAVSRLREEAANAPIIVSRDSNSLESASRLYRFDLAVFTNEMALNKKYRFIHYGSTALHSFDRVPLSVDPILRSSPLSTPEFLEGAILDVLSRSDHDAEVILIINSHGTRDLIIMPRVAADFTGPESTDMAAALSGHNTNDLVAGGTRLKGVSKIQFWHSLDRIERLTHAQFSLVFLESCESGVSSWREYFSIPYGVKVIAHSGFGSIVPAEIDYSLLSEANGGQGAEVSLPERFIALLKRFGVRIDDRFSVWVWPLLATGASAPLQLYVAPLVMWCFAWLAWRMWGQQVPRRGVRKPSSG